MFIWLTLLEAFQQQTEGDCYLSVQWPFPNRQPTLDKEEKTSRLRCEWHKAPKPNPANVLGMTKCHKLIARAGSSFVE